MKVKELIDILSKQDQELEVSLIYDSMVMYSDIHCIFVEKQEFYEQGKEGLQYEDTLILSCDPRYHIEHCIEANGREIVKWIYDDERDNDGFVR